MTLTLNTLDEVVAFARLALASELDELKRENRELKMQVDLLEQKLNSQTVHQLDDALHIIHDFTTMPKQQLPTPSATTNVTNNYMAPVGATIAHTDKLKTPEMYAFSN